ncbi:hypothetical protein [Burkholderia sp. AU28863]|uniref:hypothetical protein n=1 Tax=Burkholderia sp. AU28863 TaxID=2015352 RepID=UPI0011782121|nr:hypothetical protein [Burkholderia sp. AU28863]
MATVADILSPCLVPFPVARRGEGHIVYRAAGLPISESDLLDQYSYAISDASPDEMSRKKVFYAERYGGIGMGPHGGGARCGYDGERYHVKGIGPNPLVGYTEATGQRDGILTLPLALYEMIWSQILQDKLPFGVVECLAVVAINMSQRPNCVFDTPIDRGLLIRETYVRPAHFERAAYFKKRPHESVADRSRDVHRVAAMCQKLPEILRCTFESRVRPENIVLDGLCELARRLACQLAFARSHFLYHSISSSNVSLDGRWLDLTSSTLLHTRDCASNPMTVSSWSRFWDQESIVMEILTSLAFHYVKFARLSDLIYQTWASEIVAKFTCYLTEASCEYFLCTAGIPPLIAKTIIRDDEVQQWAKELQSILKSNWSKRERQKHSRNWDAERSLLELSFFPASNSPPSTLNLSDDEAVEYHARRLKVRKLVRNIALENGIPENQLKIGIALNSVRFSAEKNELSYTKMSGDILNIINNNSRDANALVREIEMYGDGVAIAGRFFLGFDYGNVVTCWNDGVLKVSYNMMNDHFMVLFAGVSEEIPRASALGYFNTNRLGSAMIDFYKKFDALFVFGAGDGGF